MIITTWNCNLKIQKKYEYIESLNSDITIIQECEKLKQDYFPGVQYFWAGMDEKKGLGIIKFIYAKGKLFCGENELKIL